MPPRLRNLNDYEAWAQRRIASTGMELLLRRMYRVTAWLYRRLAYENPTKVTSSGVPDYEKSYRDVYQVSSGLSVEETQEEQVTSYGENSSLFQVDILIPPLSFVPMSDQYHSGTDSTFAYTLDDRIHTGDFIIIEHEDYEVSPHDDTRKKKSRRIYLVDHVESAGVTLPLYKKLILTPMGDTPEGFEQALENEDNL